MTDHERSSKIAPPAIRFDASVVTSLSNAESVEVTYSLDDKYSYSYEYPSWCCAIPEACGIIGNSNHGYQYGDEEESSWSIDSSSTCTDDNLRTLRKSLSRELRGELRDYNKVQRLAMPSSTSREEAHVPNTMQLSTDFSNVKFSDPLVTSVKSRPRTDSTDVQNFYYSDGDIHRFETEKSITEEHEECSDDPIILEQTSPVGSWSDNSESKFMCALPLKTILNT